MTCRCPVCDQVLVLEDLPSTICCDRCDRGFSPTAARCYTCSGPGPFAKHDSVAYTCASCGVRQGDAAALLTA